MVVQRPQPALPAVAASPPGPNQRILRAEFKEEGDMDFLNAPVTGLELIIFVTVFTLSVATILLVGKWPPRR